MLDGMTAEEFDEWIAYREIEPDPYERMITIVARGFAAVCNCWGAKVEPKDLDPHLARQEELAGPAGQRRSNEVSPQQGAMMMSAVFGASN